MAYHAYYVYLLSNKANSVLYTAITNDLQPRVWEHRGSLHQESFNSRYMLVWWEERNAAAQAIVREKLLS